jgi:cytochrome P450
MQSPQVAASAAEFAPSPAAERSDRAAASASQSPAGADRAMPIPVDPQSQVPVLGALPGLLRDAPGLLLAAARRHPGQPFYLRMGPMRLFVPTQPEQVQQILVSDVRCFGKGGMWKVARPLLGNGLVTSEGDFWLRQRRLMQPLFGARHLAGLVGAMQDAIDVEVERLVHKAGSPQPIEVGAAMSLFTQRVLLSALFSSSYSDAEAAEIGAHIDNCLQQLGKRLFLSFLPGWMPLPGELGYRRSLKVLNDAVLKLIKLRRGAASPPDDLLSRLLAAQDADTGEKMSDQQIRDELITLFVAGQDTTAVALTWLFYLLDSHPEILAKLRAEIAEVVGDRRPGLQDLERLTYTRQVLQEAMRLYPPAFLIPRVCSTASMLGPYHVPAGTPILISPYVTHRDPLLWERPDSFYPEHFAPARAASRHRYAYFPFGGGSRQCIGNHFAMMEAQLILVSLVRRIRLRRASSQPIVPGAAGTLKPRNGMPMRLELA